MVINGADGDVCSQLKKRCNSSDVCVIRLLDYFKFPAHVKDYLYMRAYQPVVIQVLYVHIIEGIHERTEYFLQL